MALNNKLSDILDSIPKQVKLVAVSKTKPPADILELYKAGHHIFGENKAQELIQKQPALPEDIEWHFIGHLQRNKVKNIIPFINLIQSVESLRLLKEINKQAKKVKKVTDCLLQFHIADEETKFGLDWKEATDLLESEDYKDFKYVRICGVMGMATFTDDEAMIRKEFKYLKEIFDRLKLKYFADDEYFKEISAGMSSDYQIAIEEGSTIIRVGSAIFGERDYESL